MHSLKINITLNEIKIGAITDKDRVIDEEMINEKIIKINIYH